MKYLLRKLKLILRKENSGGQDFQINKSNVQCVFYKVRKMRKIMAHFISFLESMKKIECVET